MILTLSAFASGEVTCGCLLTIEGYFQFQFLEEKENKKPILFLYSGLGQIGVESPLFLRNLKLVTEEHRLSSVLSICTYQRFQLFDPFGWHFESEVCFCLFFYSKD